MMIRSVNGQRKMAFGLNALYVGVIATMNRHAVQIAEQEWRDSMSSGYEKLKAAVEYDCTKDGGTFHPEGCVGCERARYLGKWCFHKYCDKFKWVIERAKLYAEVTGLNWEDILDSWEKDRTYWYMNYYQETNQPQPKSNRVRIFDTLEEFKNAVGEGKFRCPRCGGITTNPYECNANKDCDWKVFGLMGDLGKGIFVYVKEKLAGTTIFMPISWEEAEGTDGKED